MLADFFTKTQQGVFVMDKCEKIMNLPASTSANIRRSVLEDRKIMAERKSTGRVGNRYMERYKIQSENSGRVRRRWQRLLQWTEIQE
jgi:hypothetical protein